MKPDNLNHDPLTSLLGRMPLEQPSEGFTNAVMGKISLQGSMEQVRRIVWERIPLYLWILAATFISLICLYVSGMFVTFLLSPENHFLSNATILFKSLFSYIINIFRESKYTSLCVATIVAVVTLLVIDQGVMNRKVVPS